MNIHLFNYHFFYTRMTEKINRRMPTLKLEDIGPQAGLRADALHDVTPALLFVNALCRVLALDEGVEHEVGIESKTYFFTFSHTYKY